MSSRNKTEKTDAIVAGSEYLRAMTIQHHRFDSDLIADTPEAILAKVEEYCRAISHHHNSKIFVRVPLTITHDVTFEGRRVARVYARWSLLEKFEAPSLDLLPSG